MTTTALKRASAINPSCPWRGTLPFPDSAVSDEDRATVAKLYAFGAAAPVTVPDVVGLSQAAATSAIEVEGLVVSVTTGYSGSVPVGDVISQNPLAGASASAGSTVTIVVSLGEAQDSEIQSRMFMLNLGRMMS